jgi:hypothetical protein
LLLKRTPVILRVVDSFIQSKTFTLILFVVALVLGAIALLRGSPRVATIAVVVGAGAVVHFLAMRFV